MELKIKTSHWIAGLPVAMMNKRAAQKIGIHAGDRISIKTRSSVPKEFSAILDIADHLVAKKEIVITQDIKKILGVRDGQIVDIQFAPSPDSVSYIKRKLLGGELTHKEIRQIIEDVVNNILSEAEVSVFVSAMYRNGMNFRETTSLIDAILYSGKRLKFRNKYVVDKHCIGGIAGNRTTPIIVSICAAVGLIMPKTSSRAITSAAGTADCIEVLSPVEFSMDELKTIVKKAGACLTWGGSLGMVPADSKIIKVEKMLKLDPQAQLLASIMSKKLAAGSKYILIDIPYGKKAKVSRSNGMSLKKKFERLGKYFGVEVKVVLTRATEPIGNGVGPALEMRDVMDILNPKKTGPQDLEKKSVYLAGVIFELTKKAGRGKGEKMAREVLESGKAWDKFREIIKAQKGKVKNIVPSKICKTICASRSGKIKEIDNKLINYLARVAGCPLDKYAGVYLHYHVGDRIKKNDVIITIYAESKARLKEAIKFYYNKNPIKI